MDISGDATIFFNRVKCQARVFDPTEHYPFAIPLSEMQKSKGKLILNPNW